MRDRSTYSRKSILAHWIAAFAVIALFLTHEDDSAAMAFHIGAGAILGIYLLWRAFRRLMIGQSAKPDQHIIFNLLSSLVIFGLLAAIIVVVISGYMLPWSAGQAIDIYSLVSIPSPIAPNRELHEFMEEAHEISGHAFIPLLALHILGTLKHWLLDRDQVAQRMFRSNKDGI